MGLPSCCVDFLVSARLRGASFERAVTLGRQALYLTAGEIADLRRRLPAAAREAPLGEFGGPADAFFEQALGCGRVDSIDVSLYEGATIAHDMNFPLPTSMDASFDAVIDSGTLEHVFNFPVAIRNCMRLVKPGGRLFVMTVANNHCGHGFYQFSPELFFRLFDRSRGFSVQRLLLVEHPFPGIELSRRQVCYEVQDPDRMRYRVGLVSNSPIYMLVEARRECAELPEELFPQQSDYVALWRSQKKDHDLPHRLMQRMRSLYTALPSGLQPRRLGMLVSGLYQKHVLYTLRNRKYYRRVRSPFE